jgi:hypothetical protein
MPERDEGILANPVTLKECRSVILRKKFTSINVMERSSTEVGFELDLEPMTFGNVT